MHMRSLLMLAAVALTVGACGAEPTAVKAAAPTGMHRTVDPLTVAIEGPNQINPATTNGCYWFADAHGGTAPYTFSWAVPNGSYYTYNSYILGYPGSSGDVEVWVTDANQNVAYTAYPISFVRNAAMC